MKESDILNHLSFLRDLTEETIVIIGIDNYNNFVFLKDIGIKNTDSTANAKIESIADNCKYNKCNKVILAHNHPVDKLDSLTIESVSPSEDDLKSTDIAKTFLLARGIELIDHYIISRNMHLSINNYIKTKFVPEQIALLQPNSKKKLILTKKKEN